MKGRLHDRFRKPKEIEIATAYRRSGRVRLSSDGGAEIARYALLPVRGAHHIPARQRVRQAPPLFKARHPRRSRSRHASSSTRLESPSLYAKVAHDLRR
jgi:hypothetical protein